MTLSLVGMVTEQGHELSRLEVILSGDVDPFYHGMTDHQRRENSPRSSRGFAGCALFLRSILLASPRFVKAQNEGISELLVYCKLFFVFYNFRQEICIVANPEDFKLTR